MDDLHRQRDQLNQELHNLPRDRDTAIREHQTRAQREEDALYDYWRQKERDLRNEISRVDANIRSVERPVGTLF